MRTYWYKRILVIILVFTMAVGGGYFLIENQHSQLQKEVSAEPGSSKMVIPGGMPIGIYLETNGVMVLGTDEITGRDGINYAPASNLVQPGDYIVGMNDEEIDNKSDLINAVKKLDKAEAVLTLRRSEETIDVKLKPIESKDHDYKLGIWVRDNAQGLGTVTFLNADSKFGALGHGIHDVDTNKLLDIADGTLYETSIKDIQKGEDGSPGGMEGIIIYNNYNVLGSITKNTDAGIFGEIERIDALFSDQTPIEIASKEEIQEGEATIRCSVDGNVKEYKIRITKVDNDAKEVNKGIVIEVTDPKLLEITGGIVQGMSGSPIIQNNKLIGAVTHVFVQDSTKGYGIFIENMLKNVE